MPASPNSFEQPSEIDRALDRLTAAYVGGEISASLYQDLRAGLEAQRGQSMAPAPMRDTPWGCA